MADPTQPLRDAIASGARKILPSSSPLAKSLDEADKQAEIDKINQEIAAQQSIRQPASPATPKPQLTFVQPEAAPQTPIANAVSQGPAQAFDLSAGLPKDLKAGLDEQRQAYMQESEIYRQQGKEIAKAEAQFNKETEAELNAQKQAQELETQVAADVDERARMRLEPKNFFAGKNTWQKVMGGLGLFLSSFSNEGAKRFAEAVDRDIELDLKAQESAIMAKDKAISDKQSLVKQYFDKYKDLRAARLLARADAFGMIKLRAESAASSTKSKAAAGAARQAVGLAEAEMVKAKQAAMVQLLKQQNAQQSKNAGRLVSLPGLGIEGMAQSDKEGQELRELGATTTQAAGAINELLSMVGKGASLSLEQRARAKVIAAGLRGPLRLPLIGPGSPSDRENALLDDIIANPTRLTSLSSTDKAALTELKSLMVKTLYSKIGSQPGIQVKQIGRKAEM